MRFVFIAKPGSSVASRGRFSSTSRWMRQRAMQMYEDGQTCRRRRGVRPNWRLHYQMQARDAPSSLGSGAETTLDPFSFSIARVRKSKRR
jgi:hypothetical protein